MKLSCRSKSRELDSKNMAITTCGSLESATMFQVALGVEWWHTQPRVRACCLEPRPWWYCVVHHGQAPQKLPITGCMFRNLLFHFFRTLTFIFATLIYKVLQLEVSRNRPGGSLR